MILTFFPSQVTRWLAVVLLVCKPIQATTLLNSSYDVARELFSALNPGFIAQWQRSHPYDTLTLRQSHAGSSRQALAILQGLPADVVTYNQITDVQILHDRGNLIAADWRNRLPNQSSPYYSTMAFLMRKGNPKKIHDWSDLARDGVKLVFSNPKTSGNGRYAYLAAWGAMQQEFGGDQTRTRTWMQQFLNNVEVFDIGGRGATTTFVERTQGDVLIGFESEVNTLCNQVDAGEYEVIVPKIDILAEFPVAWVDKNVKKNGTTEVAKAYLNYLFSPEAQKIIVRFYYRVNDTQIMNENKTKFPQTQLFRVEEQFGDWQQVMDTHFRRGGELDQLLAAGRHR
ncbi:MAG: thiosulfate/sulfate ABC transporter periplasmic binding protein CysP [Sodalis sp. Psp]|nr:thiosulfate/sulfate ABC transporter periplasmic binding protein CysP [Sodalis sp. Psp]MCR3756594.1 thiosulfate/sulfate ABC transporter periplasmic binding protein CysP [Sodalis sp. Ppy]